MTTTIDPTVLALFTAVETDLANFRAELIKLDKHWAAVCLLGTRDDSVAFHVAVGEWNKIDTAGLQSRLNGYWTSQPAGRAWAKYAAWVNLMEIRTLCPASGRVSWAGMVTLVLLSGRLPANSTNRA